MRAGKLDTVILVERSTDELDDAGVPVRTWASVATLRARVTETSTSEAIRDQGAQTEAALVLETRFVEGVTIADRLRINGTAFDIRAVKEIGRRRGLEIHAVRIGP